MQEEGLAWCVALVVRASWARREKNGKGEHMWKRWCGGPMGVTVRRGAQVTRRKQRKRTSCPRGKLAFSFGLRRANMLVFLDLQLI
jgi:hypothetical protein